MATTTRRMLLVIWIIHLVHSANSQTESHLQYPTCSEYQVETWSTPIGRIHYDSRHSDINFCFNITLTYRAVITISFIQFKFGYNLGECNSFVEVGSTDSQHFKKYCGNNLPPSYFVESNHAWVWMHRNVHEKYAEVIFSYSAEPNFIENVIIPRPGYAFITSPNFPDYAPLNSRCGWSVSHQSDSRLPIQIEFSTWNVSFLTEIKIYDGKDSSYPILATYYVNSHLGIGITVVTTSGPHAYIHFTTSEYVSESLFNATVKIKGYCLPGTYSCNDGSTCYKASQKCNVYRDCSNGFDELGCRGCSVDEYLCGLEESDCYTDKQHCNGMKDCSSSIKMETGLSLPADELNCKSCGPGAFFCPGDQRCIYERWRCDGDKDCQDNSDEEGCPYVASRRVITATAIGSLVCGLLLVIALGCTCKLYSMRSAHHTNHHHMSRATPLTRVERELFRRQAPPSYDMTVDGVGAEPAMPPRRSQRLHRHRNRRYQFQRSMPASFSSDDQPLNRRSDSIETDVQPSTTLPASSVTSQRSQLTDQAFTREARQSMASIVFESVPDIIAEMFFTSRQQQQMVQGGAATSVPSTGLVETRDSGTQTNINMHGRSENLQSGARILRGGSRQSSSGQDGRRHSGRGSSRSRSRNRRSRNSREQQAKPLPKKKKILPVMVSAPCMDQAVEDTLTCVYPSPPSYSQAVASESISVPQESVPQVHVDSNTSFESYSEEQEVGSAPTACAMSPKSVSVTRSKVSFPFSIGKAFRSLASPSFSKLSKNPYVRMAASDDGTIEDANTSSLQQTDNVGSQCNVVRQNLPSETSSDEDLLDIALGESSPVQIIRCNVAEENSDEHKPTSTVYLKPIASPDDSKDIVASSLHVQDANSLELTHFSLEEEA